MAEFVSRRIRLKSCKVSESFVFGADWAVVRYVSGGNLGHRVYTDITRYSETRERFGHLITTYQSANKSSSNNFEAKQRHGNTSSDEHM